MGIFVNTLVYVDQYKDKKNQIEMIKELVKNGHKDIEIRREFINDFDVEIKEIANLAKENNVNLYYSIPDTLYKNGSIDKTNLDKYMNEVKVLGSKTIKLAVGNYKSFNSGDDSYLNEIINSGVKLYVENDQTNESGTVEKIKKFLDDSKTYNVGVKATFDVGNWIWVGEDPKKNADILDEYIDYVHFKDVKIVDGKYQASTLGEGIIDWKYFKNKFKNIQLGIEYPCSKDAIKVVDEEVKKLTI